MKVIWLTLVSVLLLEAVDMEALQQYKKREGRYAPAIRKGNDINTSRIIVVFREGSVPDLGTFQQETALKLSKKLTRRMFLFDAPETTETSTQFQNLHARYPGIESISYDVAPRFQRY